MFKLAFLGTGIMRIVNFVLIATAAFLLIYAAWSSYKDGIRDEGRQEVIEEVEKKNDVLDRRITEVNENIVRRVTTTTENIDRRSREIEDVINDQPSEPITNVTRTRLERVREQQRNLPEANR